MMRGRGNQKGLGRNEYWGQVEMSGRGQGTGGWEGRVEGLGTEREEHRGLGDKRETGHSEEKAVMKTGLVVDG
jgi:hypothetical protein